MIKEIIAPIIIQIPTDRYPLIIRIHLCWVEAKEGVAKLKTIIFAHILSKISRDLVLIRIFEIF